VIPRPTRDRSIQLLHGLALLSTGVLAGAFGYGAANLVPTFNAVPLDVRLSFHTQLMRMNGITMQGAMGISALSALALAVMTRGVPRRLAGGAGALVAASFLITRFGNVPINGRIKQWAATSAPADHADVLARWEAFNYARTATAFAAFTLLTLLALRRGHCDRTLTAETPLSAPRPAQQAPGPAKARTR
jgi:uncharacterized membrane protein